MSTYYIASEFSSTGSNDFTCVFYDSTGYSGDMSGKNWSSASGFMYVGDNKGAIGWGKTTDGTTDIYTKLTPSSTGFKYGIYADTNGLYAVVNGSAIPYDEWGTDPLYTKGDFQDSVLDRLATPPSSPTNGDRYLIIATATGDWTGYENNITEYQDGWVFISPSEGMITWVEDENVHYIYSGSSWSISITDYINDIGDVTISSPADNEILAYNSATSQWINQTASEAGLEPAFTKNTAFNKDFAGSGSATTVSRSDHSHDYGTDGRTYYGSTNAVWQPVSFVVENNVNRLIRGYGVRLTSTGTSGTPQLPFWLLLPTQRKGIGGATEKLYIDGIRVGLMDSDSDDYISRMSIFGVNWNSATEKWYDDTDVTVPQEIEKSFTAIDFSSYSMVAVRIDIVLSSTTGDFDLSLVQLHCYYST